MTLNQQLSTLVESNKKNIPTETYDTMIKDLGELIETGIEKNILAAGEVFPDVELLDSDGNKANIKDYLKNGPVIVSFYRGGWCPYCNLELKTLETFTEKFSESNAQLIAVSPETPDNATSTKETNKLTFPVLSDVGNILAKELKLTFNLKDNIKEIYNNFGIDIEKHNGNQEFELPLAATYIIGTDGIIKYAEATANYTVRAEPSELIKYL